MIKHKFTQSLSFRLSLIVAGVVLVGVCLVAGLFIVQDFQKTVQTEQGRLENIATAFAAASSAPLLDGDTSALYQVLRGISEIENSTFINAKDINGKVIAEIGGSVGLSGRDGSADEKSLWSLMQANTLSSTAPIWSNGLKIGTLAIHSDISWLRAQYATHLAILITAAIGFALFIAATANWVVHRALRPLKQMSHELLSMGENPDLAKRFSSKRNDEVGILADAFNGAFKTIQNRDNAIREHRDTLETTVEERTSELKIAAEEAKQANAAKSEFLATMSHEIRTPMNGMLVMAELLSASDLSSRQQRFAEVIARSGNSLLHIINDILDMSKIEAGKLDLEEIPFSLNTLVEDTVSLYAARAHEKELKIAMVISPEIAEQFIGDPTRLGQVLSNLTNNALKFTESGGVTIRVTALPNQNNRQKLTISVSDTGIGIAPEKLDAIFEAFSQADQSTTRNYGGTGLGLSISKRLTEAMYGEISATSIEGEGTTFNVDVTLPVHADASLCHEPQRSFNIGVADNSVVTRHATIETLKLAGLNAFEIQSDQANQNCDLILTGAQDLSELEDVQPGIPILLMTEYGDSGAVADSPRNIVANITSPLTNADAAKIIAALNAENWSAFEAKNSGQKTALSQGDFKHLKVLAVDDNAVNREVLNEALTALDVKAVFASDGQEAVDLATVQHFDIIFMDCSMPGMDGYQATAAIRENGMNRSAHIAALTAHVTGPSAEQWKSAGMDSYVAKPFTVSQLSNVMSQVEAAEQPETILEQSPDETVPLLSNDVLSMFEMVSKTTGNDMKAKVFTMFCEQVDLSVSALIKHCKIGEDTESLKELAHALKSMCSSAGALAAQMKCDDFELKAEVNVWPTDDALACLKEVIEETKAAMRSEISDYSEQPIDIRLETGS